jgi:hypothetical protein
MTRPPVARRSMTPDEIRMGTALGFVRCVPATFDKRFVGEMAARARDEPTITEKQATLLRRMVHKYRRQIPADVVRLAGECPPAPWTLPPAAPVTAAPPPPPPRATPAVPPQLSLL